MISTNGSTPKGFHYYASYKAGEETFEWNVVSWVWSTREPREGQIIIILWEWVSESVSTSFCPVRYQECRVFLKAPTKLGSGDETRLRVVALTEIQLFFLNKLLGCSKLVINFQSSEKFWFWQFFATILGADFKEGIFWDVLILPFWWHCFTPLFLISCQWTGHRW